MKTRWILILVPIAFLFMGCAHHLQRRCCFTFLDQAVAAWRRSAVEAAASSEEWARVGAVRPDLETLRLDTSRVEYKLDCAKPSQLQVIIPILMARGEYDQSYVKVVLDRDTGLVLSLREEHERY
jgi:hypothetical protein